MYIIKSSSLAVLATLVTMCCGHIGGSQLALQDVSPQVYCGRTLARVLAMLCYDEVSNEKRSESGTMFNSLLTPYNKDQENQLGWPWIPPQKARGMGMSRGKRFVVSECCDKACSISELMSYC
ncbi:Samia bombyxin protein A-3 [Danaus plexippus plexippus]|uniref:Samia bombyxin protein A-3 n=1 Tax=Danaus plexippus plexippus TaxID=278856 RepID=A0A212F2W7_DANPL|nr:insulin-related peptide 2-like [Danaus plexippus plexippus]OWR42608.1 Samia bombyxin protein A-3 [Danaus plexippus plexippus]OWR48079.1 Samia bombyxin protein A-3 [Danaus plexippus plexippus]